MPATIRQIGEFLASPDWSPSEKWVIKWQFRQLVDSQTALCEAIKRADEDNLAKLSLGFPIQVQGFQQWAYGDLATRLRQAGLEI